MEQEIDFQSMLLINKNNLDEELISQSQKMMILSSRHAQSQYDRDRTKQSLDVTKANLDASIRAELAASGAKFTEAVVDGRIRSHPNYIEAQEKHQKAEYEVNLLLGAVMAMNARKGMLESLVKLFLSGYWSEPRVQGGEDLKAGAAISATEQAIGRSAELGQMVPKPEVVPQRPTPRPPMPPKKA